MIVFVDVETTGLDPEQHEVIEVGLVAAEHRDIVLVTDFSLAFDPKTADPEALKVNGWGERNFPPVYDPKYAAEVLNDWFSKGELFCAWHSHFDEAFLRNFLKRQGEKPPWSHRSVIDLPSLVMGRLGVVTAGSSRTLMQQLGMDADFEGRHSALADARANFEVYRELKLYEVI